MDGTEVQGVPTHPCPYPGPASPTIDTAILIHLLWNGAPSGQRLSKTLEKAAITQTFHKVPSVRCVCLLGGVLVPASDSEALKGLKGQTRDIISAVRGFQGRGTFHRLPSRARRSPCSRTALTAEAVDQTRQSYDTWTGFSFPGPVHLLEMTVLGQHDCRTPPGSEQGRHAGRACGGGRRGSDLTADPTRTPNPLCCAWSCGIGAVKSQELGLILQLIHSRGEKNAVLI